jgi:hypothetical protein
VTGGVTGGVFGGGFVEDFLAGSFESFFFGASAAAIA